jgi:hypothetical protein
MVQGPKNIRAQRATRVALISSFGASQHSSQVKPAAYKQERRPYLPRYVKEASTQASTTWTNLFLFLNYSRRLHCEVK